MHVYSTFACYDARHTNFALSQKKELGFIFVNPHPPKAPTNLPGIDQCGKTNPFDPAACQKRTPWKALGIACAQFAAVYFRCSLH